MAFRNLVGQSELKNKFKVMFEGQPAQSFLITGAPGMGKHKIGEELAKALLCMHPTGDGACDSCPSCTYFDAKTHPDIKRIEAPSGKKSIKIADIRSEVISDTQIVSQISQRKVYIINADQLNEDSQNSLLKSLEEPPKGVAFILLCSDASKLLGTILSRVLELRIAPYKTEEIIEIIKANGNENLDSEKMSFYASFSANTPGRALSLIGDEAFSEAREHMFNLICNMPSMGYTDLIVDEFSYFEKNKDRIEELLLLAEWTLGDIGILLASPTVGNIKNMDKKNELKKFISSNKNVNLINVSNAVLAINEFARGLRVNVSFDGACSSMLLKIYKELVR